MDGVGSAWTWTAWVYPRVCGGTPRRRIARRIESGLSPRVRGNLILRRTPAYLPGSIPACAGEPDAPAIAGGGHILQPGLSPRVRGNLLPAYKDHLRLGSIPACAGEPRQQGLGESQGWVYPRVCGGTWATAAVDYYSEGLSPRVRGNPNLNAPQTINHRSIPACAGEPMSFTM